MQGEELSKKIFDVINNVSEDQFIYVHDMETGLSTWSQSAVDYFGLPATSFPDATSVIGALVHPDDFPNWIKELNDVFALRNDGFYYTYHIRNAQGEYVQCTGKGKIVGDEKGDPAIFTGSITIHKKKIEYDSVTDLPKLQEFQKEVRTLKAEHQTCLTMAVELRRFHNINTLYGYNFGSKTLYEVSHYMKRELGDKGKIYRLEGTIFGFLLQEDDLDFARELYAKIREGCSKFMLDGCALNLEVAGAALYTKNHTISSQTILSCLLSTLEKAKEEDSYDLVVFDDESHESNYKMMELLDAVKAGIRNECSGFYVCYQPFVSTVTGRIIGAEALVRYRNPIYGEVSPGRFVPHLESHPCFYDLSIWVLRQAIHDAKQLLHQMPGFFINVNMSYSQLERENFKQEVIDILEEYNFPKEQLQLELTERCRNMDLSYLREQLQFFRSHGIKIALDDFGTGTSTINLLCDLPITCVKIDQSFILNILDKTNNKVIVDTTVQCAKRLGLNVCLEGVETLAIKEFIGQYNANYHQGYYYSKPVEFERFKELLEDSWTVSKVSLIKGNPKENYGVDNILSMMPGGFFIYANDSSEKILSVNEMLLTIYECDTLDEFLIMTGGSFRGMVHPDDYARVSKSIDAQIAENEEDMDFVKYRIMTKSGRIKHVRDYGHLVRRNTDTELYYVFLVEERDE